MSRAFQDAIDAGRLTQGRIEATAMWWLTQLLPRPMSVAFAVVAACSTIPWMAFAAQALSTNRSPRHVIEMASATTWMCALPTAAPFALASVILAGSWGGRFVMSSAFSTATGAVSVALVALTLALGGRDDDLASAVIFPVFFLTPLLVLTALFGVAARTEGTRRLLALRAQRALDLLDRFGSLEARILLEALGGSLSDAADALDRAHAQIPLERAHGRVWTASRYRAHKALLLAQLESGERSVASLVAAVREPEEVVRAWLARLVEDDLLDVVIDGDDVELQSEAQRTPCSGCGGSMALVGRGLWRCLHCGNERTDL